MDLKQLLYFTTIAKEGSISAAAQKLFMSQPPLSCQMKLLEEELNCKLFERGSRCIQLTEEGQILYNRAISLLELSKLTKEEVLSVSQKERGTIRIGMVSSIVSSHGTKWISDFSKKYPDINYEIYEANTYQLLDKLKSGTIHFAILRTPYHNNSYISIPLANDSLVAIGDAAFFENTDDNISLKQLSKQPIIIYRRWEHIISELFEKNDLNIHYVCINDDARTTIALTENKLGIGLVPKSTLSLINNQDIICKTLNDCHIVSGVELIYNPACYIPHCGKLFIDYMKSLAMN